MNIIFSRIEFIRIIFLHNIKKCLINFLVTIGIIFLLISEVKSQTNTTYGIDALPTSAPKYNIERIDIINQGNYQLPIIDLGGVQGTWDYKESYVDNGIFKFYGFFITESNTLTPTIVGGSGVDESLHISSYYDSGSNLYYYEITSQDEGYGYGPLVSLTGGGGFSNTYCYIDSDILSVYVSTITPYTSVPNVIFSFGTASAIAVLSNTIINGNNTAIGYKSLNINNGNSNTGVGSQSGLNLSTGYKNTFIGSDAGKGITTGFGNTIIGNTSSNLSSNLSNTVILADGNGNQRFYSPQSGNVLIGYGNNPLDNGIKFDVNGIGRFSSNLYSGRLYSSGINFLDNIGNSLSDFVMVVTVQDPDVLRLRAIVDTYTYLDVFTVNKMNQKVNFNYPISSPNPVNDNDLTTKSWVQTTLNNNTPNFSLNAGALGGFNADFNQVNDNLDYLVSRNGGSAGNLRLTSSEGIKTWLGLGSAAYTNSNNYLLNNGFGDFQFASSSTALTYPAASLELRESNFTANASATPPRLSFHWGGVVASQIGIESSGRIAILNNPGTGYEDLISRNIFSTSNIGIGTSTPKSKLQIVGAFDGDVIQDGNDRPGVNISGWYPQASLIAGGTGNTNHGPTFMLGSYDTGTSGNIKHWSIGTSGQQSTFLDFGFNGTGDLNPHAGIRNYGGNTVMTMLNSGNVGIGVLNPSERLEVNGMVKSKEVKVQPNGWPDFVFDENYKLIGLDSTANYIKEYKHLPDLPSAKEIKENGLNLGEMDVILLKKIEELTLYMIEMKKENELMKNQIQKLINKANK